MNLMYAWLWLITSWAIRVRRNMCQACSKMEVVGVKCRGRGRESLGESMRKEMDMELCGLEPEWARYRDVWRKIFNPSLAWKKWAFLKLWCCGDGFIVLVYMRSMQSKRCTNETSPIFSRVFSWVREVLQSTPWTRASSSLSRVTTSSKTQSTSCRNRLKWISRSHSRFEESCDTGWKINN